MKFLLAHLLPITTIPLGSQALHSNPCSLRVSGWSGNIHSFIPSASQSNCALMIRQNVLCQQGAKLHVF
eukprot:2563308-Amphidinium_carterae.1